MPELERDIVLSAIRRGEDSLPKLRTATGLDYAKLHPVLHELEFEWKSINSRETADGFLRFTPTSSEKSNGGSGKRTGSKGGPAPTTPPQALRQTKASVSARDMALLQRDAPYCVTCRGLCLFNGLDLENLPHWRCQSCKVTFEGSSAQVEQVAHIDPHKEAEAKIAAMIERGRVSSQPEQPKALPDNLQESQQTITEIITNNGDISDSVSSPRPGKFGISIKVAIKQIVEAMPVGTETDTPRLYDLLVAAHPHLRNHDEQARLRTYISQGVKPLKGKLLQLVHRGTSSEPDLLRRIENGTSLATETGQPERAQEVKLDISKDKTMSIAGNPVSNETSNEAPAKERDIIPEKFQSQDTQMVTRTSEIHGSLVLREEVQLKVEEIAQWPPERIAEFFDAISKVVGIPQRPLPSEIKLSWSKDFEDDKSSEGILGLTYLYLVSMLHDGMEEHEKNAVWVLLRYLKRMEAEREAREAKKGEQK